jgi:hypothetical protein
MKKVIIPELKNKFYYDLKNCLTYLMAEDNKDQNESFKSYKDWELRDLYQTANDIAYKIAKVIDYRKHKAEHLKVVEAFKQTIKVKP